MQTSKNVKILNEHAFTLSVEFSLIDQTKLIIKLHKYNRTEEEVKEHK